MLHVGPIAAGMLTAADCKMQNSFDALLSGFYGSLHELRALSMLRLEGKTIEGLTRNMTHSVKCSRNIVYHKQFGASLGVEILSFTADSAIEIFDQELVALQV